MILERPRVGDRAVEGAEAAHRRVEVFEDMLRDQRAELPARPAGHVVLVDDQHFAGVGRGLEQSAAVEGAEAAHVEDGRADAILGEFIRGGEVYKYYMDAKRFPEHQVKFYAAQIALGLGYLHDKKIVHRDLKLENVMIDEFGYLKLIDFGLAKIIDNTGVAMSFCGTPEYLAPEMIA